MSRVLVTLSVVVCAALVAGCGGGNSLASASGNDAGQSSDASQGLGEASQAAGDASSQDSTQPPLDAPTSEGDGGGYGACNLTSSSVFANPVFTYTSGSTSECPSNDFFTILGAACTLAPTGPCTATATCTVQSFNADDGGIGTFMGSATVTVTGSTATGSITLHSGQLACTDTVSAQIGMPGTPGACDVTCCNGALNNETGCDPCLEKACAAQYAACQADNQSAGGCINCSQLLAGIATSGISCPNTDQLQQNLLDCACTLATCE
jgi:hypothetical protein